MKAKSIFYIILLLLYLGSCINTIHIKTVSKENAIRTVGQLSFGRYGHASVSSGSNIYIIGGYKNRTASFVGNIEVFNTDNYSINTLSTLITPRCYLGAVMLDSNIYIIGGTKHPGNIPFNRNIHSKNSGIFEKYDLRTNQITTLPEMPTPRQYMGTVAYGEKIYIIGGSHYKSFSSDHYGQRYFGYTNYPMYYYNPYQKFKFLSTVEIYNIKSNKWEEGPPMPKARECNAVLYKNKIYVIGGFNGLPLDNFEVFDIEKNKWEIYEDAPVSMSAHSCIENNDSIIIIGDYHKQDRVLVYVIESNKWTNIDSNYKGSRHQSASCINNDIYIIGGFLLPPADEVSIIQKFITSL